MKHHLIALFLALPPACALADQQPLAANSSADRSWLDAYNISWSVAGTKALHSMPCGGGNIALNVWTTKDDLLFYIASPAFWDGMTYCGRPDMDHGGAAMAQLQEMLLQTLGDKLHLFPAWPVDWDVDFKLHAPRQTVVEGSLRGGVLLSLKVTPESRAADLVNWLGKVPPHDATTLVSARKPIAASSSWPGGVEGQRQRSDDPPGCRRRSARGRSNHRPRRGNGGFPRLDRRNRLRPHPRVSHRSDARRWMEGNRARHQHQRIPGLLPPGALSPPGLCSLGEERQLGAKTYGLPQAPADPTTHNRTCIF